MSTNGPKNQKTATSIDAEKLRRALAKRRISPVDAFSFVKHNFSWQELQKFIQSYQKPSSILHATAFGAPTPRNYGSIAVKPSLYSGELHQEARWTFLSILNQLEPLKKTLIHEKEVIKLLLKGNYTAALIALDSLEKEFGHSLTTLYYRLFAIEKSQGLGAHKKFLSNLNEEAQGNILLILITNYVSVRAETNTSAESLDSELEKLSAQIPNAKGLIEAVRAFSDPSYKITSNPAKLLAITGALPALDKLFLLQKVSLNQPTWGSVENFLISEQQIRNERIVEAYHLCFPKEEPVAARRQQSEDEKAIQEIYQKITEGNTIDASRLSSSVLERDPESFEVFEPALFLGILPKIASELPTSPLQDVLLLISSLAQGEKSESESLSEIRRLASKIPSRALYFFLADRFLAARLDYAADQAFEYLNLNRATAYLYNGSTNDSS